MCSVTSWSIDGSDSEPILGNCHQADSHPKGVVLIAHGFKGYKDYGMFPCIAAECAAAGFTAHRFNFSHSGMTNELATFARPELFERDTWNRQVFDLRAVMHAVSDGKLDGGALPLVLFGHSRGGMTSLLTAGRFANHSELEEPVGIITAAAPSSCNMFPPEAAEQLMKVGYIESPSSRTGQVLRVGREYLQEQIDDPAGHDLLAMVARIACPILIIHGDDDPTVPASCAKDIRDAARSEEELHIITGANHVFNTPNPFPDDETPSPELNSLLDLTVSFLDRVCA